MTEKTTLKWVKDNLSAIIKKSIADSKTNYTEEILAGMCMRETGILIMRYPTIPFVNVCQVMKGDYGQRQKDKEKIYHGFSFWQIDIDSFPDFVKSGDWKDPYKSCMKAISVLEGKRKYLATKSITDLRAIIAAYNCGEGNVTKAIKAGKDCDTYTYNKDYSKEVVRFSEIYKSLSS